MLQSIWLGLSFFFLYFGYNALHAILPVVLPDSGPYAISIGYVFYAIAAIIPPVSTPTKRRIIFFFCGASFAAWVAATTLPVFLFYMVAALNGACSGILWTNEGKWVMDMSAEKGNIGVNSAVVLVSLHLATLGAQLSDYLEIGNLVSTGFVSASIGCLLLLVMPSRWLVPTGAPVAPSAPFLKLFKTSWLTLLPSILLLGCSSGLLWVGLPLDMTEHEVNIGFALFSSVSVVAYFVWGWSVDYFGKTPVWLFSTALQGVMWGMYGFGLFAGPIPRYIILVLGAIGVAALEQAIVKALSELPPEVQGWASALQTFIYCLAYSATSIALVHFPVAPYLVCTALAIVGTWNCLVSWNSTLPQQPYIIADVFPEAVIEMEEGLIWQDQASQV